MAAVRHYLESGDTLAKTEKIFGVNATTVKRWVDRYKATGSVANKQLNRGFKKIDPVILRAYVKGHPDETQKEMATAFGGCNHPGCFRERTAQLRGFKSSVKAPGNKSSPTPDSADGPPTIQ